jgi:hypothetical protein
MTQTMMAGMWPWMIIGGLIVLALIIAVLKR